MHSKKTHESVQSSNWWECIKFVIYYCQFCVFNNFSFKKPKPLKYLQTIFSNKILMDKVNEQPKKYLSALRRGGKVQFYQRRSIYQFKYYFLLLLGYNCFFFNQKNVSFNISTFVFFSFFFLFCFSFFIISIFNLFTLIYRPQQK